ncbi:cell division protein ZapA [Tanticharoenia sakaeratensis]|jgi:cell division protein ZapA|uniref:Cell division protein ZapA n=1 Tax=Tanticharoenia sakaeratensis NBRC 103193 TaxID=1231623 RepID=A0A0D6MQW0_9PROT|nr:cell division protein ZapA [Tanticharoenia sakaeratensis]GAN55683.1 hypothetical protein Tasa_055_014 [Tanticharoenia sakaeratensis NBRC 103193]GBQ18649.1 hypothetical protein AA103193_0760 [Tanticharoenia sakaeratensis NBRC 103193]
MGQVAVRLNGFVYTVGCRDGEESHLQAMAQQVQRRIDRVRALGSQSTEGRTLALAALLMADELHDLAAERMPSGAAETLAQAEQAVRENTRRQEQLLHLAERAEGIAAELEQP